MGRAHSPCTAAHIYNYNQSCIRYLTVDSRKWPPEATVLLHRRIARTRLIDLPSVWGEDGGIVRAQPFVQRGEQLGIHPRHRRGEEVARLALVHGKVEEAAARQERRAEKL